MHRFAVVSAVLFSVMAICGWTAKAACAEVIYLADDWSIEITNFYLFNPDNTGFYDNECYIQSTTNLVEPKLLNPTPNQHYNTLAFDFHTGQVGTGDMVEFFPLATTGGEWSGIISFNWTIHCSDARVVFGVVTDPAEPGDGYVWWSAPAGSDDRSGTATFSTGTIGPGDAAVPPAFRVSFIATPEPSSLLALFAGFAGLVFSVKRLRV